MKNLRPIYHHVTGSTSSWIVTFETTDRIQTALEGIARIFATRPGYLDSVVMETGDTVRIASEWVDYPSAADAYGTLLAVYSGNLYRISQTSADRYRIESEVPAHVAKTGGVTVTFNPVIHGRYVVADGREGIRIPAGKLNGNYLHEIDRESRIGKFPGFGVWVDKGLAYLEPVRFFDDIIDANAAGYANGEACFFDLLTGDTITVVATRANIERALNV